MSNIHFRRLSDEVSRAKERIERLITANDQKYRGLQEDVANLKGRDSGPDVAEGFEPVYTSVKHL